MNKEQIPEIVNISQLCKLMRVSRSRFYQLLNENFILPPIYSLDTKRPFYPRNIAEKNLSFIRNNKGWNGKICLFYNTGRRSGEISNKAVKTKSSKKKSLPEKQTHQDLLEGLSCLGLTDIKASQIDKCLREIYPNGTQNIDEGEVLKNLYRAISAQNSTDNVNR